MVNTAPDFVTNSRLEVGRTSCIVKRRNSASDVTQGLADPWFAGWDTMAPSTSDERRRALLDAIARKRHELEEFERQRDVAKRSLEHLTAELEALDGPKRGPSGHSACNLDALPLTGPEKVALFRSLFRGRDDIFPVLWTSTKTGRTGYSPACSNEWTPGVCEKPRVRCGECPNQAFVAVSDRVILDHLQGRHVAGVYQKQRLRLSTARIPRIICRAEDFPRHVALPRGCVDDATALLQPLGATLEIDDQREDGHPIEHRFHGTSTELQEHAVRALRAHDIGVLVAPPGVGKTVAGIRMIAERARNTLVVVHLRPLLEQWVAQLAMFLDVDPRSIGRIGDGNRAGRTLANA